MVEVSFQVFGQEFCKVLSPDVFKLHAACPKPAMESTDRSIEPRSAYSIFELGCLKIEVLSSE